MATATISSKGRVTLPREVRAALGVVAGDRLDFIRLEDGAYAIVPASRSVRALKGLLPRARKAGVAGADGRGDRGRREGRVIGLDTDVLVRYVAQDEPAQSALATKLIESFTPEAPGFVSTATLVETAWVLARAYKTEKVEILRVVEGLLRAQELVIEDAETHCLALNPFEATTVDYADAVIAQAGRRAGCEFTATFDRRAASGAVRLVEA